MRGNKIRNRLGLSELCQRRRWLEWRNRFRQRWRFWRHMFRGLHEGRLGLHGCTAPNALVGEGIYFYDTVGRRVYCSTMASGC
jgi:hypothetical protein